MSEIEQIYLEQRYNEIINPKNLFKNLDEVKLFIKDSNKEDLIWFLRDCEQNECYDFCQYLKEVIDEEILQNALNDILKYFSNFNCRLKKRIFWYYLENSNKIVEVKKEKYYNLYVLIKR